LPPGAPSKLLWAAELPRAAKTVASLALAGPSLVDVPRGTGLPVMLLPGMFNGDRSNAALRRWLGAIGHDARGWGLGRNLGARAIGEDGARILETIETVRRETGKPVALVGVSLGGIIARLAAHRMPHAVRGVITVASPYAGDPRATNVWRAFEWLTGERVDSAAVRARTAEIRLPLPVPAVAIWSRNDGLVNGAICHQPGEAGCRNIEIAGSHMGVQWRPAVWRAIAEELAVMEAATGNDD
jgi:triacylglycerol lipase